MYLTARSYLLAGFTAASIVATIPLAPKQPIHLPSIHSADVRLAAAESEIASKVRTLRAVEARTVAAVADRTPTTTVAGTITPSDVAPVIGDLAAFNFDLLGAPFGIVTALSFAGDLALSDLGSGLVQDIPGDVSNSLGFGIGSELNLLNADITVLTNAINHLTAIIGPTAPSGAQSSGSTSTTAALRTSIGTFDPGAIGPLLGDTATLGLDVAATPFQLVQSLTSALSGAAMDLGAGQFHDAEQDFTTRLQTGFEEADARLSNDLNGIGTALARLTGTSNTTSGVVGTAKSAAAVQPHVPDVDPRPVGSQLAPPALTATPAAHGQDAAAHHPRTAGIAATPPSAVSQQVPSGDPETAKQPVRHAKDAASTGKSPSATTVQSGKPADGTNSSHTAPGKPHSDGPKHGKH